MKIAESTSRFAAAIQPVAASAIHTSPAGLKAGFVRIPAAGAAELPVYRAMPEGDGSFPLVLVIEEIFGVHEYIQDICRRLAKEGYCALAPELFLRQGDPTGMTDIAAILRDIVGNVPDSQVMSDLDDVVEWAGAAGIADLNRIAMTGFCWGGRVVWLYAAHSSRLKAGAAWYGQIIGAVNPRRPKTALDHASALRAPVLGLYGGEDTGIPVDQVEQMRAALAEAGKPSEILLYPRAPHGFHSDYRPTYREADAIHGWARMLDWFRRHGAA